MTKQEKIALLEETLDLEEGTLTEDAVLEDLDGYDSMAKLSVIVMLDDEFGKKISGDDIRAFKTVADILNSME